MDMMSENGSQKELQTSKKEVNQISITNNYIYKSYKILSNLAFLADFVANICKF